jgi:polyferredoxin
MKGTARTETDVLAVRSAQRDLPIRNTDRNVRRFRFILQAAFVLLCVWIGIEFHFFVMFLESKATTVYAARPPGVDGFLPISSLMSLYYFFLSGEIHFAHPAGFFILIAVVTMSFVFGKSFCSWACPVGFLSENLGDFGERIFGRKLRLPRFVDFALRSIKYVLLAFFVYSIFFLMTEASLKHFLDSPYNQVADIKMYYFFARISQTALIVIATLFVLSIVIRNFWCRYFCPYGALLGIMSLLSPHRIKRNPGNCIDCGKCARACPSHIKVDKVSTVISDECVSCLSCLDSCPVADTLELKSIITGKRIPKLAVGLTTAGLFVTITGAAMVMGKWQNNITTNEYLEHLPILEAYGHPTGFSEINDLNRQSTDSEKSKKAESNE